MATGYLARAKEALQNDGQRSLFYAAFELRCCVEERQFEYADALTALERKKLKPWRIGDMAKDIAKHSDAERISLMRYVLEGRSFDIYHTPVSPKLVQEAENFLGGLLHGQRRMLPDDHPWWAETRNRLISVYRMAWIACQGDSMVPPLYDPNTGKPHISRVLVNERTDELAALLMKSMGTEIGIEIQYVKSLPDVYVCDL